MNTARILSNIAAAKKATLDDPRSYARGTRLLESVEEYLGVLGFIAEYLVEGADYSERELATIAMDVCRGAWFERRLFLALVGER